MTVGLKDGLSNGMVDASLRAQAKVSQHGDVRPADSSIDMSSRRREWLLPAGMNRGPAGIREATSDRRLRVRVVQDQSDRLDAWKLAEPNLLLGHGQLERCTAGLSQAIVRRTHGRHDSRSLPCSFLR